MWDFFCLESNTIFESIIRQNKLLTLITHVDLYFTDYLEDFFLCLHFSIKCGTHTGAKLQLLSKQSILMKTWQYTYLNFHAKNDAVIKWYIWIFAPKIQILIFKYESFYPNSIFGQKIEFRPNVYHTKFIIWKSPKKVSFYKIITFWRGNCYFLLRSNRDPKGRGSEAFIFVKRIFGARSTKETNV